MGELAPRRMRSRRSVVYLPSLAVCCLSSTSTRALTAPTYEMESCCVNMGIGWVELVGSMEARGAPAGSAGVRMAGALFAIFITPLVVTACSSSVTASGASSPAVTSVGEAEGSGAVTATDSVLDDIAVSLSLYVLADADDPVSTLSSRRSTEEVEAIAAGVQAIWEPAAVAFGPVNVETVAVPAELLEAIARTGDASLLFDQVGQTFDVPEPGLINGFFVASAAGVNVARSLAE